MNQYVYVRAEINNRGDKLDVYIQAIDGRFEWIEEIIVTRDPDGDGGSVPVQASLTGMLGPVHGVSWLDVATLSGDIVGPITCYSHPIYPTEVSLLSVSGSLLNDVVCHPFIDEFGYVTPGAVTQLAFNNGIIGDADKPIKIQADAFIQDVVAKNIHAEITGTNTDPDDPELDSFVTQIGSIEARVVSNEHGVFTGEIRAENHLHADQSFPPPSALRFEGEMRGRIWIQKSQLEIQLPRCSPGLTGTIVYGARDPYAGGTLWGGAVKLLPDTCSTCMLSSGCQIVLDSGDAGGYTPPRTAASLGGGAAGLAPFRLHREDCTPKHQEVIEVMAQRPGPSKPIEMRHYGPVTWRTSDGDPFKIERRRNGSTDDNAWTDETGDCWSQDPDPNNPTIVLLTPSVALQRGFEYKVSLLTRGDGSNILRSDLPHLDETNDPEVYDYAPLTFKVCNSAALGDANDDGDVTFADVTNVLANFGAEAPEFCLAGGDADRNGLRNFADITEVLAHYGPDPLYCEASQQSIHSPTGDGFATMGVMEAPTSAASAATAVADALTQMGYPSIEAFTDAIAQMPEEDRNAEVRRLGQLLGGE